MAIQSKFHKDLSKFEAIDRFGWTKRQRRMVLKLIPGFVLILAMIFLLDMKGLAFWFLSFVVGLLFIAPPALKGFGKWEEAAKRLDFFMKKQDRYYETGKIRRYTADEFTQKKDVSEVDPITKK